ncbi:hypothetical protein HPB49_006881 [Dermacentor silvarum]|uniref:Uncharacterized protein n=1 Tax=Dermacentor silvarum TaxID=543639 RepID=A0ACB8DI95_DERSI|nr:hypothetical protein HPB49_006881 [Dermacentor silvarum]
MALRCAATRYASLLFQKTVHAARRSDGSRSVPRLSSPGCGCSNWKYNDARFRRCLLPARQMSRLASPTYLSAAATLPQQAFDYFLVLDFEATCSAEKGIPTPQEIIEFPVLKVNGRTFETEATFHTYVQPQAHPQLTAFCIECAYLGIPVPPYMTQWINLKKVCEKHFLTSDFVTTSTYRDEKTGRVLEVPLQLRRLKSGAKPSLFPNCPSYLSRPTTVVREGPEEKRLRLEGESLQEAIRQSVEAHEEEKKKNNMILLRTCSPL